MSQGQPVEGAVRVVLVDDDPLVRAGLRMILGGSPRIEVVAEAGDGVEGVEVVRRERPDVVLMDIRMPRRDGLEATRLLVAEPDGGSLRRPRVIVLTTFDTDDLVVQALRTGANGFLLKDTPPAQLVDAVLAVAAGAPILSPSVTAQLIARVSQDDDPRLAAARLRLATLTDREREVALAIGRGLSNAEIAAELFMGVPTVKAHVSRLLTKLGADNRVQVALTVHDAGLA
ncbi:response regulator transcription factor [Phycicoccus ginsengisoli]